MIASRSSFEQWVASKMMASEQAVLSSAQDLIAKPGRESIRLALEVLEAPELEEPDLPEQNRVQQLAASRRYLAVVTCKENGSEQAALLLFRRPTAPLIEKVLPVLADFKLSISQRTGKHSPTSARERSKFVVEFCSPPSKPLVLLAETIDTYSQLIAEVKRLQEVAQRVKLEAGDASLSWLDRYQPYDGTLDKHTLARFDSISTAYSAKSGKPGLESGATSKWTESRPIIPHALPNGSTISDGRENWIVERLRSRESEFTSKEEIRLWCGTFNVNDRLPTEVDLLPWLKNMQDSSLLVFGFQEFDLSREALIRYTPYREDIWRVAIEKALGSTPAKYQKLHSRQLVGALLIIYVKVEEAQFISDVSASHVATGILGFANKGATGIRLRYKDTVLTFVNSHLSAFTEQFEKRNQEFHDISRFLSFPYDGNAKSRDPWTPDIRPEVERSFNSLGIYDSHHLIWVGDLNYRVELPKPEAIALVERQEWDLMLRFDQLRIQKKIGLAFNGFEEAQIDFPPSYKFDIASQLYDTSEKQRTPSWTDRIQWISFHERSIRCHHYGYHPEVDMSDHRPVSALMSLDVLAVVPEQRQKIQGELMAELELYDGSQLPDVKFEPGPAVQFDAIDYMIPSTRTIVIKNVGRVIAEWTFVLKPDATTLTSSWLHITPISGLILPGESSEISLTIRVDNDAASQLNFSPDEDALSDLMIVSIEKKDLFMSVQTREYQRTCFANSLLRLALLGKPIRTASLKELEAVTAAGAENVTAAMPDEIKRMINFLSEFALEQDDIFMVPGDPSAIEGIRNCLDTGLPFVVKKSGFSLKRPTSESTVVANEEPEPNFSDSKENDVGNMALISERLSSAPSISSDVATVTEEPEDSLMNHSMADCFLRFLDSLTEPVIPFSFYWQALGVTSKVEAFSVVEALPHVHHLTFVYILAFLKVLVGQSDDEKRKADRFERLAIVFSAVLLRKGPTSGPDLFPASSVPRRGKTFILFFLREGD